MVDRESIQQRIEALGHLERAHEREGAGDLVGAKEAIEACLAIMPNNQEAQDLRARVLEAATTGDSFNVEKWLEEEQSTSEQESFDDETDLKQALRKAIANQDHERIISLGEALLTIAGPNTLVYHEQVAASAEHLVDRHDPDQLDVAIGWADTWWRLCHDPTAKERSRDLKERVSSLAHKEQQIRDALESEHLSGLMEAVHAITSSRDRLSTTQELLETAEDRLVTMRQNIQAAEEALAAAIPGRIDEARRLMDDIVHAQPTSENQVRLQDLQARERAVATLHAALEECIDQAHCTPLEAAIARLRASTERLSTSDLLLDRAESVFRDLAAKRDAAVEAFHGGMKHDFEQAVVALTALRRIDPDHELVPQLPKLEQQLQMLDDVHNDLERAIGDQRMALVSKLADRLESSRVQLSRTPKLLQRARRSIEDHAARERRQRSLVIGITVGVLIAIAIPTTVWLLDRKAWHAVLERPDDAAKINAIDAYLASGWHPFYAEAARQERERLTVELEDQAWQQARQTADPSQRIEAIGAFLDAFPESDHAAAAEEAIEEARIAIDSTAYDRARSVEDPAERIAAIEAFLLEDLTGEFDGLAASAIEQARREQDEARWATASREAPPAEMVRNLRAYLEADGVSAHRDEATAMIEALEERMATDAITASDEAAWARVTAAGSDERKLAAAEAYLASDANHLHRTDAEILVRRLRDAVDRAAWEAASRDDGELDDRIGRVQDYLARTDPPPQRRQEAEALMAQLERERDRRAWLEASAPGTIKDRIARLEAYLANHPEGRYRKEAALLRDKLRDRIDYTVYAEAKGVLAPGERVLALQAYLAGDTSLANERAARQEIARALDEIAAMEPTDLAAEPDAVLAQVRPTALATLEDARLLELPAETLRLLPADRQADLPIGAFTDLPPALLVKIARRPWWAVRSGVDRIGSWAELDLGDEEILRFRMVQPAPQQPLLWVAAHELTQAQWDPVMRGDPSETVGEELPVHGVSWEQARRFVDRLDRRMDEDEERSRVRLPTRSEFTAIAHSAVGGPEAEDFPNREPPGAEWLSERAWLAATSGGGVRPATAGERDGWGLYGLWGNVAEWTSDGNRGIALGGHYASDTEAAASLPALDLAADAEDPRVGFRIVIPVD